ncbi:hypothetical protein EDD85DRAFT_1028640 [Armillaria nabsnona]|nr:hypothetical protein EDD85DRAFT_1028640 [Armillaria nabsnona]
MGASYSSGTYFQFVLEFGDFLKKHPIIAPGVSPEDGSELRGARMVGRWKSGECTHRYVKAGRLNPSYSQVLSVDITPLKDDPELAADPLRNNDPRFQGDRDDQSRCPFAAHIRKTLPRADLEDADPPISLENRRILRRGIKSSIVDAFQFLQHSWANNVTFPPFEKTPATPGFDPIIGQAGNGGIRMLSGTDPADPNVELTLTEEFVVPRGSEYFFTPSIKSLKETFAKV